MQTANNVASNVEGKQDDEMAENSTQTQPIVIML